MIPRAVDFCQSDAGCCPEHGATLINESGANRCAHPGCERRWNYDRMGQRCTEAATFLVCGQAGKKTWVRMCAGHVLAARARAGDELEVELLAPRQDVWAKRFEDIPTRLLISAVAKAVRTLLLTEYAERRPGDLRPERALAAAETWLSRQTAEAKAHAAALAKACTAARQDTFGYDHRVAEAARAVATSVTRTNDPAIRADLLEALVKTEDEMIRRYVRDAIPDREREVAARIEHAVRDHAGS